jgi:hypothetical protein
VALGTVIWGFATIDSVPEEVTADRWFLVGVVVAGVVIMVMITARYRLRYSPSPQDGLIKAGWIVGSLAVPLSLFAWGDDPHMTFSVHLSEAVGAAAVVGWLAFGLCAVAILLAERRKRSSVEVQDDRRDLINH